MTTASLDELYTQFEKAITERMKNEIQIIMTRNGIKTLPSECFRLLIRLIFKDFKETLAELIKIARVRNLTNYLYLDSEKGKVVTLQPIVLNNEVKCTPFDIIYTSDPKSQFQLLEKIDTIKASEKAKVDQEKIKNEEFKGRSKKNKERMSNDPYKKHLIEKLEENKEKEKNQKHREEMQSTMMALLGDGPAPQNTQTQEQPTRRDEEMPAKQYIYIQEKRGARE